MKNAPCRVAALFAFFTLTLALLMNDSAPAARAARSARSSSDRPIVYAARYYNPPPSKARSYSHLYRINPDGTGRIQLTSGAYDDYQPVWSRDGKRITFWRDQEKRVGGQDTFVTTFCVVGARGGKITTLAATPLDDMHLVDYRTGKVIKKERGVDFMLWSPDGKRILLSRQDAAQHAAQDAAQDAAQNATGVVSSYSYAVLTVATGKEVPIASPLGESYCWAGPDRIIALPPGDGVGAELLVINAATGATTRRVTVTPTPDVLKQFKDEGAELTEFRYLSPLHDSPDAVLYSRSVGESTHGHWKGAYRVDLQTGRMTYWGETGDLEFSPDGNRFVTINGRDIEDYGKKNGRSIGVWVRPLLIGQTASPGKMKPLVSGLVIANGASWRP